MTPKIATCCYCGHRAALVLAQMPGGRHELACAACGAPLHEMKAIPAAHPPAEKWHLVAPSKVRRTKRRKKPRKSLRRRILSEIWDLVEDAVEEVFD